MGGCDAAESAPVVSSGRESHGAVEEEKARGFLDGAVGEGGAGEDLPGGVGMAADEEASWA